LPPATFFVERCLVFARAALVPFDAMTSVYSLLYRQSGRTIKVETEVKACKSACVNTSSVTCETKHLEYHSPSGSLSSVDVPHTVGVRNSSNSGPPACMTTTHLRFVQSCHNPCTPHHITHCIHCYACTLYRTARYAIHPRWYKRVDALLGQFTCGP
jgi:hypothetical protein